MEQITHIQSACHKMLHQDSHRPLIENMAVHPCYWKRYHCHDLADVAIKPASHRPQTRWNDIYYMKARRIRQWLGLLQDKHGRSYQTPTPKLEVFPTTYKATSKTRSLVEELTYCRLEDENWIQVPQEVCSPLIWRTDYNTRLHTCLSFSSMPCTMPAATGHLLVTAMPEKPQ